MLQGYCVYVDRSIGGKQNALPSKDAWGPFPGNPQWRSLPKKTPKKQNKQQTSVCVIFFVRSAKVKSTEIRAWLVTKEKCSELVAWKQRQRIWIKMEYFETYA